MKFKSPQTNWFVTQTRSNKCIYPFSNLKKITISVTLSKVYYSLYSSYNIFICNSKNEQVLVKRLLTRGSLVIVLSLKECKDSLHSQHASVFTKILPPFAFWTHFNALVFIFWGRYKNVGCEPTTETMATLNEEILKVLVIYKTFSSHAVGIVWATICYSHQTSFFNINPSKSTDMNL